MAQMKEKNGTKESLLSFFLFPPSFPVLFPFIQLGAACFSECRTRRRPLSAHWRSLFLPLLSSPGEMVFESVFVLSTGYWSVGERRFS